MSANKIEAIAREDLPRLRDLFLTDWPKHAIGYGVIKNYDRWFQQDPEYDEAKIYCLNGDWSDGTYMVLDKHSLFVYTLNEDLTKLTELVKLIPRKEAIFPSGICGSHILAVQTALTSLNFKQTLHAPCTLFRLPKARALELEVTLPSGVILKPVSVDHIPQMRKPYPFRQYHTPRMFEVLIRYNPNIGIFDETTDELMGWCLRYPSGVHNALQVEEKHKRKGYAEILVKAQAKTFAEMGDDSFACIVIGNLPSQRLFEKLEFENTGIEVTWMYFEP